MRKARKNNKILRDTLKSEVKNVLKEYQEDLKKELHGNPAALNKLKKLSIWQWALIEIYEGRPFSLEILKGHVQKTVQEGKV